MRALLLKLWRLPLAVQFAIPAVGIAGIVVFRHVASDSLVGRQPFMLFTGVVAIAAFAGGLWPAALASIASLGLGTFYLLTGDPGLPPGVFAQNVSAVGVTMLIVTLLGHVMRREALSYESTMRLLQVDREKLGFLLDSIHDGFIAVDQDWLVTYANRSVLALTNLTLQETIGRSVWEFGGSEDAGFREALETSRGGGVPVITDLHAYGHIFLVKAIPLQEGTLIYIQDVTESSRVEEQRTVILGLEREARQRAEESTRTRDEFLLTVSHELRTPLTTILGWLEIMETDSSASAIASGREAIERGARSQVKMVEQLLDLANLNGGKLTLSSDLFELNEAVEQCVQRLEHERQTRNHVLSYEPHEGQLLVRGDQDQIAKAFGAILENALVYTPSPGRVVVRTFASASSATLEVEDSGIGIDSETMPHIFDRFRQAEKVMTRKSSGLGLGLTIARAIVDTHGGVIETESLGVGQGSTFRVRLPLSPVSAGFESPSASDSLTPIESLGGCRILFVDDDPGTREVLGRFLSALGASVTVAESGAEALKLVQSAEFDVIVSDIGMPGMSGLELIEALRKDPQTSSVKALALSAYYDATVVELCKASGFHDFANKPIDRTELLTKIATLLRSA